MQNFFIDIGLTVLMRLLSNGKIPSQYVKGLKKLRDMLNLAFPPDGAETGAHVEIV